MSPQKRGAISDRPLWLIAVMLVLHIAWLVFCALWIPSTYGEALTRGYGSPLVILPVVIFVYALAPLIASFSALGREYWDLVGRGGSARRAFVMLMIFGGLLVLLLVGMTLYARYTL